MSLSWCVYVFLSPPLFLRLLLLFVFSHHLYTCSLSPALLVLHTHIHCHHHVALIDRRCHVNVRQTNKSTPGYVISFTFFSSSPSLLYLSFLLFGSTSRSTLDPLFVHTVRDIHTQTLFLSLSIISLWKLTCLLAPHAIIHWHTVFHLLRKNMSVTTTTQGLTESNLLQLIPFFSLSLSHTWHSSCELEKLRAQLCSENENEERNREEHTASDLQPFVPFVFVPFPLLLLLVLLRLHISLHCVSSSLLKMPFLLLVHVLFPLVSLIFFLTSGRIILH